MLELISKLSNGMNLNKKTSLISLMMFFSISFLSAQVFCGDLEGTSCDNCPEYSVNINPDLMVDCGSGIQMILLIDESNSIWNSGVEQDVADGVNAFLQSLACSSVDIAIIEFGSVANFVVQNYTPIGTVVSGMEDYFNGIPFNDQIYSPNPGGLGGTNWQAALLQANAIPSADMVLLLTDGVPTTYTPVSEFPQSSFDYCGNGTSTQAAEIYNSVQLANALKLQGTHMFVMGVGPVNTDYIADISGFDEFGDEHSIATADYFFEESFDSFIDSFADVANSLCPLVNRVEGSTICEGSLDGTISLYINEQAVGPFSITIDDNLLMISNDHQITIENLPVGTYDVTIEPFGDCFGIFNQTVIIEGIPLPTVSIQSINELCVVHNPVQLTAFPTGGAFSGEGVSSSGIFQMNSAGEYAVTYTFLNEENGCEGSDSITIRVVDCCEEETAFAYYDEYSTCFSDIDSSINRWGWTNGPLTIGGNYTFDLIAGAGRCRVSSGEMVGEVSLNYTSSGDIIVTYFMGEAESPMFYELGTVHVYIGCHQMPESIAPGQMPYQATSSDGTSVQLIIPQEELSCNSFYFIAHAEVSVCNSEDSLQLGVSEINTNDSFVTAYPVPFRNNFSIRYKFSYDTDVKIELIDINGRILSSTFNYNCENGRIYESKQFLQTNSSQIVFLKVITSRGITIKKLISL